MPLKEARPVLLVAAGRALGGPLSVGLVGGDPCVVLLVAVKVVAHELDLRGRLGQL